MIPLAETFSGKSITKHCIAETELLLSASFRNFITRHLAQAVLKPLVWELGAHAANETFEEHGKQPPRKNS
jgi:hypothetical protein